MKANDMPETRVLETQRLLLKELTPELWKFVLTQMSDKEIETFLGLYHPGQIAQEKEKCRLGITNYRISFKMYLMIEKATKQVVGKIAYHTWRGDLNRSEIGYNMDIEEYKNKGFMSETMPVVLKDGFEYMNLNRVEAFISPDNTPSRKLVEKFGFGYEGLLREHYLKNGIYHDSVCYGLLLSDYEKLKHQWQ